MATTTNPASATNNPIYSIYSFVTGPTAQTIAVGAIVGMATSFLDGNPLTVPAGAILGGACAAASTLPIAQKIGNLPIIRTLCSIVKNPEVSAALLGAAISYSNKETFIYGVLPTAAEGAILAYSAKKAVEKTSFTSSQVLSNPILKAIAVGTSAVAAFNTLGSTFEYLKITPIYSAPMTLAGCYGVIELSSRLASSTVNKITQSSLAQNSLKIACVAASSYTILQTKTNPFLGRIVEALALGITYSLPSAQAKTSDATSATSAKASTKASAKASPAKDSKEQAITDLLNELNKINTTRKTRINALIKETQSELSQELENPNIERDRLELSLINNLSSLINADNLPDNLLNMSFKVLLSEIKKNPQDKKLAADTNTLYQLKQETFDPKLTPAILQGLKKLTPSSCIVS